MKYGDKTPEFHRNWYYGYLGSYSECWTSIHNTKGRKDVLCEESFIVGHLRARLDLKIDKPKLFLKSETREVEHTHQGLEEQTHQALPSPC